MKHKRIESTKNPLIKETLRERHSPGSFIIEGAHLIEEAIGSGAALSRIFASESFIARNVELLDAINRSGAEVVEVSEGVISKLAETEAPQGAVAVASCRPYDLDSIKKTGLLVVADGIQDPGNLGAIIRTADAVGAGAVIVLPGTANAFASKTVRASAGSIFHVPIVHEKRQTLPGRLKARGVKMAVTVLDAELSLFDADLRGQIAFVFGGEAAGVSPELREAADIALRVPIPGRAESLNVASAAAVCLYEALRQRRSKKGRA